MTTEKVPSLSGGVDSISPVHSTGSHLQAEDHEVNLDAVLSNPLSLSEVGTTLTDAEKRFVMKRLHFDVLENYNDLPPECSFMFEKIEQMSPEEAVEILKEAIIEHQHDVNIQDHDLALWKELVDYEPLNALKLTQQEIVTEKDKMGPLPDYTSVIEANESDANDPSTGEPKIVDWNLQVRLEAVMVAYWAPYPEVRAITLPFDDPTIPVETFRVYLIGIIWTAIGAVINQFFTERQPAITLAVAVVQIFLYPSGLLCEWILPKWKIKLWKNWVIDLNPGPYTFKEQMLATIFCSVSGGGTSYVSSNILMQKSELFYDNKWVDFGYQVLLILSTNFMGIGLAGIIRKFAVYPVQALWPIILPGIALNKALLTKSKNENINGWTISGYAFFFITFAASFLYFWVPDYLFQALSYFSWMAWIKPDNQNLAAVTGFLGGLGLNPISTFDWNIIRLNSPLQLPFYNQTNMIVGMFIALFGILGLWYTNYKWTGYIPINSNVLYTNTGEPYAVTAVVNEKSLFDESKYQEIGPPFYSAANLFLYGAFFAIYPFHIVYEIGM